MEGVDLVRVQGREKRARRAYTPEEVQKLLGVAGRRAAVYLTAVLTGLRRGELQQLRWRDVLLDGGEPAVTVRASIAKNHREARLPLHADVVAALRNLRPANWEPEGLIFAGMLPRMKRFRGDLKAAGIDGEDEGNGCLDFHSLRVTYCTQLAAATPSERVRMELMRHHDPKLTAETYTDARMLGLSGPVGKLAFHQAQTGKADYTQRDTQRDTQTGVLGGQSGSLSVTSEAEGQTQESLANKGGKSFPVASCHAVAGQAGWCALQGLNLSPEAKNKGIPHCDTLGDSQADGFGHRDLLEVIAAWPTLARPLKAAILAIVKSAKGEKGGQSWTKDQM